MNVLLIHKNLSEICEVFSCKRFFSYVKTFFEWKLEPNFLPSLFDTEKEQNKRIREIKRLKSH